jgi:pyruvate,water dikinase
MPAQLRHLPKAVVTGLAVSPGIVTGTVKIITDLNQVRPLKANDIIVASQLPAEVLATGVTIKAIILDQGGYTSPAAILSSELGIPCIVGTQHATQVLHHGQTITVDADTGRVYDGPQNISHSPLELPGDSQTITDLKTKTQVMVNLSNPEIAARIADQYIDGVGLCRADFLIREYIGTHPHQLIAKGQQRLFTQQLADGLADICQAFSPRPVLYQTTDMSSQDYQALEGAAEYEPDEPNPLLGLRGALRYIKKPRVFELELTALSRIRNKLGHTNLHLIIPFIRTLEEFKQVKKLLWKHHLKRTANCRLYIMVEVPNTIFLLDKFISLGIDGVVIGSSDLTMLMLGIDSQNPQVADALNPCDPGLLAMYEHIIATCHQHKVTCMAAGSAPGMYIDLTRHLVNSGIDGISVDHPLVDKTRVTVYMAEQNLRKRAYRQRQRRKTATAEQ